MAAENQMMIKEGDILGMMGRMAEEQKWLLG